MRQGAFGLVESGLVGPGVDLHDRLPLLHLLALSELDRQQLAADTCLHRDAHVGRDRAQCREEDRHGLLLSGGHLHGNGPALQGCRLAGGACRSLLLVLIDAPDDKGQRAHQHHINEDAYPKTLARGRLFRSADCGQIGFWNAFDRHDFVSRRIQFQWYERPKGPNAVPPGKGDAARLRLNGRCRFRGSFARSVAVQGQIFQRNSLELTPMLDASRNHCMRNGRCRVMSARQATRCTRYASPEAWRSLANYRPIGPGLDTRGERSTRRMLRRLRFDRSGLLLPGQLHADAPVGTSAGLCRR